MHIFSTPFNQSQIWKYFLCTASPKFCTKRVSCKKFSLEIYLLARVYPLPTDDIQTDDNRLNRATDALQHSCKASKTHLPRVLVWQLCGCNVMNYNDVIFAANSHELSWNFCTFYWYIECENIIAYTVLCARTGSDTGYLEIGSEHSIGDGRVVERSLDLQNLNFMMLVFLLEPFYPWLAFCCFYLCCWCCQCQCWNK